MNEVTAHDWKTGKCFIGSTPDSDVSSRSDVTPRLKPSSFKKFNRAQPAATPASVSPLYNPCHPNALVMPRPGSKHQMEFNRAGLPVVDVVVDPHLTVHLRPHQREGVTFLYECVSGMREMAGRGAILADEMGLGKTLQCITTIWTLIKQGPYGRKPVIKKAIIVTPGSLVKNWEREFHKWLGSERLRVFAVSTDKRVEEFVKSPIYPVLIVSYEMFLRSHETLCRANFDLIVCDEGHRLKNGGAKTTSMLMRLTTRRRIVLTGTPIQNDLHEFYSIVEFCNPGVLGSHAAFCRVYEGPIVQSRQPAASMEEKEIGEMRANELNRLVSLFCLRRTQEINNKYLPPKVENVVFCQMASLQLSLYHHLLESSMVKACVRHVGDTSPHLKCIGALKKLCNCPSLLYTVASAQLNCDTEKQQSLYDGVFPIYPDGYDPQNCDVHHSGKLVVLNKMLVCLHKDATEKIVLVSNYTQTLDLLQRLCKKSGYQFLRLDGSTPASNRQSLVEQFNNKHSPQSVFLLSSKAGGVGLNLTGASRLVLYDSDWNPANDLQAMARVWRDGQRKKVHIYRLLTTGSIEEKIYQRQISKQGLSMVVEGHSTSGATQFSLEELKDLFTLHDSTLCDTHDLMGCNCMGGKARGIDTPSGVSAHRNEGTKRIAADELMKWRHCNSPLASSGISDELLLCASLEVTFVFQNESNKS